MKRLEWRSVARGELAQLLKNAPQVSSTAVGDATIYQLENDGRETLAIALTDGQAVIVEAAAAPLAKRRRRVDKSRLSPASR